MKNIFLNLKKYRYVFVIIVIGIVYRLLSAIFFNHAFDYLNILALVKSVADTGSLLDGFFVVKRTAGLEVQLYGKIYYQIAAVWLKILEMFKLIDIKYIFDTKAYEGSANYMGGFLEWGIPLYQLIVIKFVQFFYDFIFLFFLIKISNLIRPNSQKYLFLTVLFWALNPIVVFSTYVLFQSDLVMITALTGAVYFVILSLKHKDNKTIYYKIAAFVFLAVGAVIKQIPMLFFPLALILLTDDVWSLLTNTFSFIAAYFITIQPWASDISIINRFFLQSKESQKLFSFNLNGVPVFMIFYLVLLVIIFLTRKKLKSNPFSFIYIGVLLFSILYISLDNSLLFAQFNSWILPFLLFSAYLLNEFSIALVIPLIGFYKRVIVDSDILTGSLALSTGKPLHSIPTFNILFAKITDPIIINYAISTVITFLYLFLLIYTFTVIYFPNLKSKILNYFKSFLKLIKLEYVIVGIFIFYLAFQIVDFKLKSNFVLMTDFEYKNNQEVELTKDPVLLEVNNPEKKTINGLTLTIYTSKIVHNGNVLLTITDTSSKKIILSQKINHYMFHDLTDRTYRLYFNKTIKSSRFIVKISNPDTFNNIYISKGELIPDSFDRGGFYSDSSYYKNSLLTIKFPKHGFVVNVNGQYDLSDMVKEFMNNINDKPTFFIIISVVLLFLIGSIIYLLIVI